MRMRDAHGPFYGGEQCSGDGSEQQDCNTHRCPGKSIYRNKQAYWYDVTLFVVKTYRQTVLSVVGVLYTEMSTNATTCVVLVFHVFGGLQPFRCGRPLMT